MNSHYQSLLSLPMPRNLTTSCCCHYWINEFSIPVAVVTTGSMNSHYQSQSSLINEFSLLDQSMGFNLKTQLNTSSTGSLNSHYQSLLSLLDQLILTTSRCCHYWINEFSLPVAVVTTEATKSHYHASWQQAENVQDHQLHDRAEGCRDVQARRVSRQERPIPPPRRLGPVGSEQARRNSAPGPASRQQILGARAPVRGSARPGGGTRGPKLDGFRGRNAPSRRPPPRGRGE
jgi:hypothetical protein